MFPLSTATMNLVYSSANPSYFTCLKFLLLSINHHMLQQPNSDFLLLLLLLPKLKFSVTFMHVASETVKSITACDEGVVQHDHKITIYTHPASQLTKGFCI